MLNKLTCSPHGLTCNSIHSTFLLKPQHTRCLNARKLRQASWRVPLRLEVAAPRHRRTFLEQTASGEPPWDISSLTALLGFYSLMKES